MAAGPWRNAGNLMSWAALFQTFAIAKWSKWRSQWSKSPPSKRSGTTEEAMVLVIRLLSPICNVELDSERHILIASPLILN